jgi:hypothetical protein
VVAPTLADQSRSQMGAGGSSVAAAKRLDSDDPVLTALEAAATARRSGADARALRRRLLALLAQLDDEEG